MNRIFMLFKGVKEDERSGWLGAQARSSQDSQFWKEVVRVDEVRNGDIGLLRVLEWGGMEILR